MAILLALTVWFGAAILAPARADVSAPDNILYGAIIVLYLVVRKRLGRQEDAFDIGFVHRKVDGAGRLDAVEGGDEVHLRRAGIGETDLDAALHQGPNQTLRSVHRRPRPHEIKVERRHPRPLPVGKPLRFLTDFVIRPFPLYSQGIIQYT